MGRIKPIKQVPGAHRYTCAFPAVASALLSLTVFLTGPARAARLTTANAGLVIDAGSMGTFTLTYPHLLAKDESKPLQPIEKQVSAKQTVLKYAGGTTLTITVHDPDTVDLDFGNLSAAVQKFRMDMLINFGYSDGGTWQIGGDDTKPFPKEKPGKPQIFQGNESKLRITNFGGKSLSFEIPPYSYQQLQDNREWNWKTFEWIFWTPVLSSVSHYTLKIAESAAAEGTTPGFLVDRFGQDAKLAFPGKVTSEADMKADVARDKAWYGSLQPPQLDTYGGLPGNGAKDHLQRTGFFHAELHDGHWLMVDPDGNAVFHLGICAFQPGDDYTYIKGREQIYEWLPSYDGEFHTAFHPDKFWSRDAFSFYVANVIRKYDKPYDREEWAARIIPRVRKWGFNSSGAFSSVTQAQKTAQLPYVSSLPLGEWDLGHQIPGIRGLFDPFDGPTVEKIDKLFAERLPARADDPLLIGYFLANEQAFEDIPRVLPTLKANEAAKVRLVQWLQNKYSTIAAFNQAWGMKAVSFDALKDTGLPVSTKAAASDLQEFAGVFLTAYYRVIADTFHKYDHHHLLLGNRWQPGTANNEQLCRIAGKYVDIISVNYYTYAVDTDFLNRIHQWSGNKPMMLSEFYWSSPSDTGLPGGKEVGSQQQRGLAYRNYVERAAATGYVVGIEWFTLIDQARSGRFFQRYNGENANSGLLNVADRPYKDCLDEMMKTNYGIYQVLFGQRPAFHYDDPKFTIKGGVEKTAKIPRATGTIRLDGTRAGWPGVPPDRIPGSRLVEGANAGGVEASFHLCWDDAHLYVLVEVMDPTPMQNTHKGDSIWNGDGVELFIGHEQLDTPGPLLFTDRQVLLSAGKPGGAPQWYYAHSPRQYDCGLIVIPRGDGTGYTLEAAIPFNALGFQPHDGQQLRFDLAIDDSTDGSHRIRQLMWNGIARNSGDRTHWGRAVLVK